MMGRETLIRAALATSLAWPESDEKSQVERITALSLGTVSNDLGAAIVHSEGSDVQSVRKVVLLVARKLNHKHSIVLNYGEKIATAAFREYLDCKCRCCGGRGNLYHEAQVVAACAACDATGVHRYSDVERENLLGGKVPKKYNIALDYIRDAMAGAVRGANKKLDSGR